MRSIAKIILVVIVSTILLQPVVEFATVMKEKIVFSSNMNNALIVAKNDSINILSLRDLNAEIDTSILVDNYAKIISKTMGVEVQTIGSNTISFKNTDKFKNLNFTITKSENTDVLTDLITTTLNV